MDKKVMGLNAGKVWQALNEVKEISIPESARKSERSDRSRIGHLTPCQICFFTSILLS